jgi:hypothetical protein
MTASVFSTRMEADISRPSRLQMLVKRFANAIVASRLRSIERELHRREAFIRDLGARQDHSPGFLDQTDLLPFKL